MEAKEKELEDFDNFLQEEFNEATDEAYKQWGLYLDEMARSNERLRKVLVKLKGQKWVNSLYALIKDFEI